MAGFEDKVAIVTGAASGIGLETAAALARQGACVLLVDRDRERLEAAERNLASSGGKVASAVADIADADQCAGFVAQAVERFGGLDIAVNNAGVISAPCANFEDIARADWERQLSVNLTGTFLCMQAEVPALKRRGGGAIVNTISLAGIIAAPGMPGYIASKHGVTGLTKAAALDLIRHNIRVNAVCPGMIDTPLLSGALADPHIAQQITAAIPAGRMGKPEEIAQAILFLASGAAPYMVGACITIDGGSSLL